MVITQQRDEKVLALLEKYKVASLSQIHEAVFKVEKNSLGNVGCAQKRTRDRMRHLYDAGMVNRVRGHIDQYYVYYPINEKIPLTQMKHRMLLLDFAIALRDITGKDILNLMCIEYPIGKVRADGLIDYQLKGNYYAMAIEVQRNYNIDLQKYIDLYESKEYAQTLTDFPLVVVISDKGFEIPNHKRVKIVKIKEDMSDIEKLLDPNLSMDYIHNKSFTQNQQKTAIPAKPKQGAPTRVSYAIPSKVIIT